MGRSLFCWPESRKLIDSVLNVGALGGFVDSEKIGGKGQIIGVEEDLEDEKGSSTLTARNGSFET